MSHKGRGCRLQNTIFALETFKALTQKSVTINEMAGMLGCSYNTAQRYIAAASIVFTVCEEGSHPVRYKIVDLRQSA